ncbi:hypothetical protein BJ741DRAFT_666614 [Chytriomyces cf. hyalinus JEL632]|nr:hypothetical protein BJ741DRAFT_666614 [Chytriomyces cf. hyalinus JEL632]
MDGVGLVAISYMQLRSMRLRQQATHRQLVLLDDDRSDSEHETEASFSDSSAYSAAETPTKAPRGRRSVASMKSTLLLGSTGSASRKSGYSMLLPKKSQFRTKQLCRYRQKKLRREQQRNDLRASLILQSKESSKLESALSAYMTFSMHQQQMQQQASFWSALVPALVPALTTIANHVLAQLNAPPRDRRIPRHHSAFPYDNSFHGPPAICHRMDHLMLITYHLRPSVSRHFTRPAEMPAHRSYEGNAQNNQNVCNSAATFHRDVLGEFASGANEPTFPLSGAGNSHEFEHNQTATTGARNDDSSRGAFAYSGASGSSAAHEIRDSPLPARSQGQSSRAM